MEVMLSLQMNTAWETDTIKHPNINVLYVTVWCPTELKQDIVLIFHSCGQNYPLF